MASLCQLLSFILSLLGAPTRWLTRFFYSPHLNELLVWCSFLLDIVSNWTLARSQLDIEVEGFGTRCLPERRYVSEWYTTRFRVIILIWMYLPPCYFRTTLLTIISSIPSLHSFSKHTNIFLSRRSFAPNHYLQHTSLHFYAWWICISQSITNSRNQRFTLILLFHAFVFRPIIPTFSSASFGRNVHSSVGTNMHYSYVQNVASHALIVTR